MTISKEIKIANISVVGEHKSVHVATDTLIKENNNLISQSRHRKVLYPNMDISNEPQEVKNICNTVWTQQVKDAWADRLAASENE
jgi:hypothetical protein